MSKHIHYDAEALEKEDSLRCPYCGAPLYDWAHDDFHDMVWEEINTGTFNYQERCENCEKMVSYDIHFTLTSATVYEEKNNESC